MESTGPKKKSCENKANVHGNWIEQARCSVAALRERQRILAKTPLETMEHLGNMSHMLVRDSDGAELVSLVSWDDSRKRVGQLVTLGSQTRAIFAIARFSLDKELHYSTVIVADIGLCMEKVRARERPAILVSVVRFESHVGASTSQPRQACSNVRGFLLHAQSQQSSLEFN